MYLNSFVMASGGGSPFFSASTSAISTSVLSVPLSLIGAIRIVDNSTRSYIVGWRPGSLGVNHLLFGARVGYYFPTMLPLTMNNTPG